MVLLRRAWLFALLCAAHGNYLSLEEMVLAGQQILDLGLLEQFASRWQRFAVAADTALSLEYGAYGEFPVRSIAEILHHPLVRAAADLGAASDTCGPDDGVGGGFCDDGEGGSVGGARFVDFGSGAGRLCLAVAAMHAWGSVVGVEAMEPLHSIADMATRVAEQRGALREGVARSLHSADALPHEEPVAPVLARADITFLYSTAFPSEDGLRLPRLSASLASVLREGSLVITADKWLVGERFRFEDLTTVRGENDELIHVHIWRVVGPPPAGGYEAALVEVDEHWAGEDACADNERACQALLAALGEQPDGVHL